MQTTKTCRKCGIEKQASEFKLQKLKTGKTILTSRCRTCLNEYSKLYMREYVKKPGVREAENERDKRRYHEVIKVNPVAMEEKRKRAREYQSSPESKARVKEWYANAGVFGT